MRDPRQVYANHEAGHAVTAWACGIDTAFVNIIKTGDREGGVLLTETPDQKALFSRCDKDYVRRRILVHCAGLAADYRHASLQALPEEVLTGFASDQTKAEECMALIGESHPSLFLRYSCLVQSIFNHYGWTLVEKVANILLERDELSPEEIASMRFSSFSIPNGTTDLADQFTG